MGTQITTSNKYFCTIRGKHCIVEVKSCGSEDPLCVRILEILDPNENMCTHVDSFCMIDSTFQLGITELEPIITDVFKVGDIVQSSGGNPFTVVGFELLSNKVIVKSNTNYDDRKRYAYKHNELTIRNNYYLSIGKRYKVNKEYICIAAVDPNFTNKVLLVCIEGSMAGGMYILTCKSTTEFGLTKFLVTKEELTAQQINTINIIK